LPGFFCALSTSKTGLLPLLPEKERKIEFHLCKSMPFIR